MPLGSGYLGQVYLGAGYTSGGTITGTATVGLGGLSVAATSERTTFATASVGFGSLSISVVVIQPSPGVGHEREWIYATPTGTLLADEVTQFLTLHGVQVIAQGSVVVSVSGSLSTWQTLGEVDQPFTAPATVGWVRVPLSSTELAPTTEDGWQSPAPVTVSIYEDASGVPGTLVTTTTIPAEQIEAIQASGWPEPMDVLFGDSVADTQASLPQLVGTGWSGFQTLTAGAWGVLFATQSTNPTQMWIVPFDGADLGGWVDATTLPVSGIAQAVYAPTATVVVVESGGTLYSATFSQDGTVGSWQAITLPPVTITGGVIGILTFQGQDFLVVVTSTGTQYYAALSAAGDVSTWVLGPSFPVGFISGTSLQVGGETIFVTQNGGLSTVVTLSAPGAPWSVSGTLPISATSILGSIGPAIVSTNGAAIDATTLSVYGAAPSWSLPVPLSVTGSKVALLVFPTGVGYAAFWIPTIEGQSGFQQTVYQPFWVSVPLPASLTAGSTYHLVLSASESLTEGVAVPVVTSSADAGLTWNGSAWVALGGSVPLLIFYGTQSPPLALVGKGKTTVMWFETPSGTLVSVVELVGNTSQSRVMTYAENVLESAV